MHMKKLILSPIYVLALLCFSFSSEKNTPLWLRYPNISPDGKTIVFNYKGDIYKVDAAGGAAVPLTLSDAHDFMAIWSPDGKWIAYASDKTGNYDIYLMPSDGGESKRLTFHSSPDLPAYFTPDGKSVVYSSNRQDEKDFIQCAPARLPELYTVPVSGGQEKQLLTIAAEDAKINKAGDKIIFHDRKGYEDAWRKHHTSAITRDVWMYDLKSSKFTMLSDFAGEDRNPIFSNDEKSIYFLSEKSGNFNIWKMDAADPTKQTQVSKYEKNPVRFLSASSSDMLCYSFNGEIYTQAANGDA